MKTTITLNEADIATCARLSGTLLLPQEKLIPLIVHAGLEALSRRLEESGEVTFPLRLDTPPQDMLPVYLPKKNVLLARELCEAADVSVDDMLHEITNDAIISSLKFRHNGNRGCLCGIPEMITESYQFSRDEEFIALAKMAGVVGRWKSKEGEVA